MGELCSSGKLHRKWPLPPPVAPHVLVAFLETHQQSKWKKTWKIKQAQPGTHPGCDPDCKGSSGSAKLKGGPRRAQQPWPGCHKRAAQSLQDTDVKSPALAWV
eukprot:1158335-Pelagomonas_calceolata.AAC.4